MTNDPRHRTLPPELEGLAELALDLRWTGSQFAGSIWRRLDEEAWERNRNPYQILLSARQESIEEAVSDRELLAGLADWLERRRRYLESPGWFGERREPDLPKAIAYFSMEFGLSEALPIHSGGLGILAGDHLKSASDLAVPVIGIGLLYQQGYFRQVLGPDGRQLEALPYNDPSGMPVVPAVDGDGRWPRVRLELPGRTLRLRAWEARVGKSRLFLLDSNDPMNVAWDRGITASLYAAGRENRLLQEIALGVGGWRLLELLGIEVDVCHLNEGHAAFLVLARAASYAREHGVPFDVALRVTRAGNVFTTHTPVKAAFDEFEPELLATFTRPLLESMGLSLERIFALGRVHHPHDPHEPFNMAYLAMRGSGRINGVSRLHGVVSRRLFQVLYPGRPEAEVPVQHITNGVHVPTWDGPATNELLGGLSSNGHWTENLEEVMARVSELEAARLWDFRGAARQSLVEYVRRRLVRQLEIRDASPALVERASHVLDPNALTLGFARRFTPYKRPTLLLHDPQRMARLLRNREYPVQLIVAGKAHPNDGLGKEMVQAIAQFAARDDLRDHVVFLEDYDMVLAQHLVGGVDVWLNAPLRPNEACGTSGMKTLVNGGLNLSILDGWWDEAYSPEAGWCFGADEATPAEHRDAIEADQLYALIETGLVPEFYDRDADGIPRRWVERVRTSMATLTPRFSSDRMVRDYVERAYLPAAEAYHRRRAEDSRLAIEIEQWRQAVRLNWRGLRFVSIRVEEGEEQHRFDIQVYLGDLSPDLVSVELYADPLPGDDGPTIVALERQAPMPGAYNGHRYGGSVPAERPAEHYTARIVPYHRNALLPLEASEIFWS